MDAFLMLLAVVAAILAIDTLVLFLGQDSRSFDDDWARPWSSTRTSEMEC